MQDAPLTLRNLVISTLLVLTLAAAFVVTPVLAAEPDARSGYDAGPARSDATDAAPQAPLSNH